jgi:hypothetical protein
MLLQSETPQAVIIDSGSTNRRGVTITVDEAGNATVQQRGAEPQSMQLSEQVSKQLMRDIKAAGTLSALPPKHCMKSASFGSSLYVEFNGDRSPDLSCSPQPDSRAAALQKDANEVLQTVRQQLGLGRVQPVRPIRQ